MEKEVQSILAASGLAHDKQVAEQEALALQRLSPEEIRERQAELTKMRNLLFYHELKAKRAAKIKSKAYGPSFTGEPGGRALCLTRKCAMLGLLHTQVPQDPQTRAAAQGPQRARAGRGRPRGRAA